MPNPEPKAKGGRSRASIRPGAPSFRVVCERVGDHNRTLATKWRKADEQAPRYASVITVISGGQLNRADPAIHIQLHRPHLKMPLYIVFAHGWQHHRRQKRNAHLSAMRMAGK